MEYKERLSALHAPELFLPELEWNPPEDDLWFQSDRVDRTFAHLVGFDGVDSQLVKVTSGKLQVVDTQTADLELALCGAGDTGLDDLLAQHEALELALCGATDKGLDDVLTALGALRTGAHDEKIADLLVDDEGTGLLHSPVTGDSVGRLLEDVRTAVEGMDTIITDCYDSVNHRLKVTYD